MTSLGKNLVFHLKYQAEMERLYWKDQVEPPHDLPDPAETMKMVETVGDASKREAADFLEFCGGTITEHFRKIANCKLRSFRAIVEKNWDIPYSVWAKGKKMPAQSRVYVGVYIYDKDGGEIIPWLWVNANHDALNDIRNHLGDRVKPSPHTEFGYKVLSLDRIAVPALKSLDFEIDADPLLAGVRNAFSRITQADLNFILSNV